MNAQSFKDFQELVDQKIELLESEEVNFEQLRAFHQDEPTISRINQQVAAITPVKEAVTAFASRLSKDWSQEGDRVIGHILWAPKIEDSTQPYGYTKDFCVIHLDKRSFKEGFLGNAIPLMYVVP
ncbi:TPR-2 domain protein [Mycena indigotica]|uniref:TPR-2 domain protein n=1 Tax=Mycena indigotica TaxID=2126181 RepID=A0A8H6SLR2_9AGAR|nr:TPR-2 domain protein [Mycena indigotica]KAF7301147.1 TPR-2 domain protein [Mycena indigotica]